VRRIAFRFGGDVVPWKRTGAYLMKYSVAQWIYRAGHRIGIVAAAGELILQNPRYQRLLCLH